MCGSIMLELPTYQYYEWFAKLSYYLSIIEMKESLD